MYEAVVRTLSRYTLGQCLCGTKIATYIVIPVETGGAVGHQKRKCGDCVVQESEVWAWLH